MEKSQELAISQMRKSVEILGSSTENYTDETMMRFLTVKSMDPKKAGKMFVEWQKWRSSFVPLGFIPDSEVSKELEVKCVFLQGLSKQGSPVLLAKANLHCPPKDQLQFKKYVVHIIDKTIASSFKEGKEIGNERIIAVLDLKGISYKNVDPRGFIISFQLLQAYYPERLGKMYFMHMPAIFTTAWKVIRRFLDKEALERVVIVRTEKDKEELIMEIGEEILPEEYGGRSKFIPIQDVTISP